MWFFKVACKCTWFSSTSLLIRLIRGSAQEETCNTNGIRTGGRRQSTLTQRDELRLHFPGSGSSERRLVQFFDSGLEYDTQTCRHRGMSSNHAFQDPGSSGTCSFCRGILALPGPLRLSAHLKSLKKKRKQRALVLMEGGRTLLNAPCAEEMEQLLQKESFGMNTTSW